MSLGTLSDGHDGGDRCSDADYPCLLVRQAGNNYDSLLDLMIF